MLVPTILFDMLKRSAHRFLGLGYTHKMKVDPVVPIREWWGEDDCEQWMKVK